MNRTSGRITALRAGSGRIAAAGGGASRGAGPEAGEGEGGGGSSRAPALLAGALAAFVLAVAVLLLGRAAERGEQAEALSTYRATPDGAKAAFVVLERLGHRARRHTEPLVALEGIDVLVVLEPRVAGIGTGGPALFDDREVRALQLFVRDGGCLVIASRIETPLHGAFGVRLKNAEAAAWKTPFGTMTVQGGVVTITATAEDPPAAAAGAAGTATATVESAPLLPSAVLAGIERVSAALHPRELIAETASALPLLARTGGEPGAPPRIEALSVREGRGRAVFFADPSPFSNAAIGRADNALVLPAIAAAHARGGAVAFDEAHHGFTSESGVTGYIGRRTLAPSLVQAAAAFLVLALALGGRRGRPPILAEEKPPESVEHIRAMAEIYAKARLGEHVAGRLYRSVVRDVEVATGLVVGADRPAPLVVPVAGPSEAASGAAGGTGPAASSGAGGAASAAGEKPPAAPPAAPAPTPPFDLARADEVALVEALRASGVRGFRSLETIGARRRRIRVDALKDPRAVSEADLLVLAREIGRFEDDCRRALGQRFGAGALEG